MAGKPTNFSTEALSFALSQLSKNNLIDLLVIKARSEIMKQNSVPSEKAICKLIDEWMVPIEKKQKNKKPRLKCVNLLNLHRRNSVKSIRERNHEEEQ